VRECIRHALRTGAIPGHQGARTCTIGKSGQPRRPYATQPDLTVTVVWTGHEEFVGTDARDLMGQQPKGAVDAQDGYNPAIAAAA
jgi:hypothetical protein